MEHKGFFCLPEQLPPSHAEYAITELVGQWFIKVERILLYSTVLNGTTVFHYAYLFH